MVLDGRGQRDVAQDSCFRRLALYAEESYVLVSVDPANGEAWFKAVRQTGAQGPVRRARTQRAADPLAGEAPPVLTPSAKARTMNEAPFSEPSRLTVP